MLQQIQTGSRRYIPGQVPRQFLNPVITSINNQNVSILGNAIWGLPLIPQTYKDYKINEQENINRLNDFETNLQSFQKNHIKYQGNILPYIAGYSILNNQGQLNFTRLVGIDLPKFPNLKPGFTLNETHKIYLMTINLTKNEYFNNHWNYDIDTTTNYFQGIIITQDCSTLTIDNISTTHNTFQLKLTPVQNNKFINNSIFSAQDFQQKKIYVDEDKPNQNILFDFNVNNTNTYWKNVLNTNIFRLNDFGYALINYSDVLNKINFEDYQVNINNITLTELDTNSFRTFTEAAHAAKSPWVVSQGFYTLSQTNSRNDIGLKLEDRVIKLFKIHACCPGELGNNFIIKLIPVSLTDNDGWARFHLHLIDKNSEHTIYEFNNLDLNPDSQNFIGRVIGTEEISVDINSYKITSTFKEYPRQNPWIRVELSTDVLNKNILQETIPCGYLGLTSLKNNLKNITYQTLNNKYVSSPQFNFQDGDSFDQKLNLQSTHAWGKNLKNINIKNLKNQTTKFFKKENIVKQSKNTDFIKFLEYKKINLNLNRGIEEKVYLNTNYYTIDDNNFQDMFHLEKIILLNIYNSNSNNIKQFWNYSKYIQSGDSINNLNNQNAFSHDLFEDNSNLENLYYYFTVNTQSFLNQQNQIIGIDSIEEAVGFNDTNILSFNMEMSGGWDGLNLLDINEYSINDKGLNQSEYLRELYKTGLEIILNDVNGQNEIIYLPEIFNLDITQFIITRINNKLDSILLLDKPFYNSNSQIIYSKDLLTLDAGFNNIQYHWYQQKYKYLNNHNIDSLNFNFNISVNKWSENNPQLSNLINFTNYVETKLLGLSNSQINININHTFILPVGLLALNALVNQDLNRKLMNPIHNLTINSLGEFQVYSIIENSLDHYHPNLLENLQLINNLNINLIHTSIKNGELVYSFLSDKTSSFDSGNNNVLTKINARNTLNDIKKKIKLASYLFLFESITSKANISNRISLAYSLILSQYVNNGLIKNFKIKLDESTTSDEDLLMGLIRGAIYLEFNNQEIVQIPV